MALQGWRQREDELQSQINDLKITIGAHPPGELPPYVPPDKPSSPWNPGKSPAPSREKLAGLRINPNTILLPREPAPAESDDDYGEGDVPGHPDWKLAHGEGRGPQPLYHDEYNRPLDMPPWIQMFPDGKLREIPWMKEKYLNEHPELASGPDYIGDKLRYGQLDKILNPFGDFRKPTLDQLRIHKANYPIKV